MKMKSEIWSQYHQSHFRNKEYQRITSKIGDRMHQFGDCICSITKNIKEKVNFTSKMSLLLFAFTITGKAFQAAHSAKITV